MKIRMGKKNRSFSNIEKGIINVKIEKNNRVFFACFLSQISRSYMDKEVRFFGLVIFGVVRPVYRLDPHHKDYVSQMIVNLRPFIKQNSLLLSWQRNAEKVWLVERN